MFVAVAAVAFQLAAAAPPLVRPTEVATLVARARAARLQQESALASYEAIARQRLSADIGLAHSLANGVIAGTMGAMRLAARYESVARVGWDHAAGAWGEVLAARSAAPIVGEVTPEPDASEVALVLPYYPGRDPLWPTSELHRAMPKADDWIRHPLEAGSDSVYAFSIGDSIDIRLPDRTLIRAREIRVRPRRPSSQLIVGSLWVDAGTGRLVRFAYRPSTPVDLWPLMEREIGKNDRDKVKKLGPFTGNIREIIVDHGLYQGQFWLPKTRVASAEGTAMGGRVTISITQTFEYSHVTAMPAGVAATVKEIPPSVDPRTGRVRLEKWYGVEQRRGECRPTGDSTSARWQADSLVRNGLLSVMVADGIRMRVLLPCDHELLATSPLLPSSFYGPTEQLFPAIDFKALRAEADEALSIDKQAEWNPQPFVLHYGWDKGLLRYNRIEGVSAGIAAERELGKGYTFGGLARLGVADWQPLAEVYVARGNVADAMRATAYRRLAASNDWGNPLGLAASLSAAAFGHDDGFYYRTLGAELTGSHRGTDDRYVISWRLFGEQQTTAKAETQVSLAHTLGASEFVPNIVAREGGFFGGAATVGYMWGLDPRGWVITGNTRVESATGVVSYGRAMTELSIARGLGETRQLKMTAAAGTSLGELPAQRWWYLGGPYTVRGHAPGSESGDAFWMGRAELTGGHPMVRPIVFGDVGWAGPRTEWSRSRQPMSGAGLGLAMVDGLVRLDVSRGIQPTQRWRADFYFEIR